MMKLTPAQVKALRIAAEHEAEYGEGYVPFGCVHAGSLGVLYRKDLARVVYSKCGSPVGFTLTTED